MPQLEAALPTVNDPHAPLMQKIRQMVTHSDGALPAHVREQLGSGRAAPQEMADLVEKIRNQAWTITDSDVQALLNRGFSEDELFEMTIATALSAALKRLDAGLKALETHAAEDR
jgi:alkylhydroperoxidase family enzyme